MMTATPAWETLSSSPVSSSPSSQSRLPSPAQRRRRRPVWTSLPGHRENITAAATSREESLPSPPRHWTTWLPWTYPGRCWTAKRWWNGTTWVHQTSWIIVIVIVERVVTTRLPRTQSVFVSTRLTDWRHLMLLLLYSSRVRYKCVLSPVPGHVWDNAAECAACVVWATSCSIRTHGLIHYMHRCCSSIHHRYPV